MIPTIKFEERKKKKIVKVQIILIFDFFFSPAANDASKPEHVSATLVIILIILAVALPCAFVIGVAVYCRYLRFYFLTLFSWAKFFRTILLTSKRARALGGLD